MMSEWSVRYRLGRRGVLLVFGQVLVCMVAGWGAHASWSAAVGNVVVSLPDGTELVSRTYAGHWVGLAIGLGMVAAALLMHAVHRLVRGSDRG